MNAGCLNLNTLSTSLHYLNVYVYCQLHLSYIILLEQNRRIRTNIIVTAHDRLYYPKLTSSS